MKTQVTDDRSRIVLRGEHVNPGPMGLNYCDYYVAVRENNDTSEYQNVSIGMKGLTGKAANELFDALVKYNRAVDWAMTLYGCPLCEIPEYYYGQCQDVRINDFYFNWKEALDIRYAKLNYKAWSQCPVCGDYQEDDECLQGCGKTRQLEEDEIDDIVYWLRDIEIEYLDQDIIDALLNEGYNAYLKYREGVNNGSN